MKILQWLKARAPLLASTPFVAGIYAVMAILLGVLIFTGDSKEEREAKETAQWVATVNTISTASAEKLEAKIKELHANEIHTERVIQTETIKPVFTNICANDEYVRLLNESIDRAERTLSGQPDSKVPGKATAPPG